MGSEGGARTKSRAPIGLGTKSRAPTGPDRLRIHIDTDPGLDDLMALAFAFASPELDVEAITTVAGNASIECVTDNALRFLSLSGLEIPVGRGAAGPISHQVSDATHFHGEDGRCGIPLPEPASRAKGDALTRLRQSVEAGVDVIVALGPLTNLAELLLQSRRALDDTEIIWMGGSLCGGNVTPVAEFNCYADPAAVAAVLSSGASVRVIGLDVTERVALCGHDLPDPPFGTTTRGRVLGQIFDAMTRSESKTSGEARALLHDPSAIAAAFAPELFRCEDKSLETCIDAGDDRGRILERDDALGRARYAVDVDHAALTRLVMTRVSQWCEAA